MKKRSWYIFEAAAVIISLVIAVTLMVPKFLEVQITIVSKKNFPDKQFRTFIEEYMNMQLGIEPGAAITKEQALRMSNFMDCSKREIKSIKGIEYFPNITGLDCHGNELTEISLENNVELISLVCAMNKLTSLDISTLDKLHGLVCEYNQISEITLSKQNNLKVINISHNQMDDISIFLKLKTLHTFYTYYNNLSNNDLNDIAHFKTKMSIKDFKFEKQNNGTFQVDPNHGDIRFLPSKTTE